MHNTIIVAGRPRSGSTLLSEQLYRNSSILGTGELFSTSGNDAEDSRSRSFFHKRIAGDEINYAKVGDERRVSSYLDYLVALCKYREQRLAFKLLDFHSPAAWRWVWMNAPQIIYVYRDNPLAAYVSMLYAQRTGYWHIYNQEELAKARQAARDIGPLHIEPRDVMREFIAEENFRERIRRSHNRIEIPYSALRLDFEGTMQTVWEFLHMTVPVAGLEKPRQMKISDSSLPNDIQNYEELSTFFRDSSFEKYVPNILI